MKEKILKILKEEKQYVSGEKLRRDLGISRSAIWKHMNQLREQGYKIHSKSSLGYFLEDDEEKLNKEELGLIVKRHGSFFKKVEYFNEIDSTNQYAKKIGNRENTLIVANAQTKGKGRMGRDWTSINNQGIYMTLKLHPDLMPTEAVNVTQIMALAAIRALRKRFQIKFQIKWPNDIVYEGKKIAGILTEMSTEINRIDFLAIGIGINVFQDEFDDDLKERAISLSQILKTKEISRLEIIEDILVEFIHLYQQFESYRNLSFINQELNDLSSLIGKEIMTTDKGEVLYYKAIVINDAGELIVEDKEGNRRALLYGEVSVRGLKTYGN